MGNVYPEGCGGDSLKPYVDAEGIDSKAGLLFASVVFAGGCVAGEEVSAALDGLLILPSYLERLRLLARRSTVIEEGSGWGVKALS
jgi:hypothetical protein